MPQVPTLTNQVRLNPLPGVSRAPLRSTVGEFIGRGLSEAGGVLQQFRQEEQRKADRASFIEASTALSSAENDLLYDPQKGAYARRGKDAFDLPNQVLPEFDRRVGEISGGLKSDTARQAFNEEVAQRRTQITRDLDRHEYGERERYYDETDEALITSSVASAARAASDPQRIAAEIGKQQAVLGGMAKRKGWDQAQLDEKRIAVETKTHEAVVNRLMLDNDYVAAGRYLAANASRMEDATVESLQRRVILEEEQQFARAERRRKLAGDAVAKEGDRLFATGALTSEWIEKNRNILDPGDYRYFYGKLRGGEDSPGDPMLYADLRDRAGRGEDVRDDAREALRRNQIRTGDYDRILGEVEGGRPGWYKRGKDFISTSAAVSDLNPDPAGAQRKAAMINDWDDWTRANPKATDEQASQAAQRIVKEYAIVDYSRMALMKRSPQFLVGTRNAPDFDATEVATVKALDEQRITPQEFEKQAALIKEWREAFAKTQQPKAQPSK